MKYLCGIILLATLVAGRFSDDFYQGLLADNRDKNLIVSPLSVEMLLSMVYTGAFGNTAQELRRALDLPEDKAQVATKYKNFLENLSLNEKVAIIELANRIYVNDQYSIVPSFNYLTRLAFNSEAESINLGDPGKAASIVNKWVNDTTHGRIKDILTPGDMDSSLVAVLLNAIYFKGEWRSKFEAKNTKPHDFYLLDGGRTSVQMMSQESTVRVGILDDLDAKVIELPYRNSSLSMVIFLPNEVNGLKRLQDQLESVHFSEVLRDFNLVVKIPKFKIEFKAGLKQVLMNLGIRNAFVPSGDFTGLVSGPRLHFEKVLQKAFIEVNEEGAEAAAVTVINIFAKCASCSERHKVEFVVDHPFAFIIRDNQTVYFRGQVTNPNN